MLVPLGRLHGQLGSNGLAFRCAACLGHVTTKSAEHSPHSMHASRHCLTRVAHARSLRLSPPRPADCQYSPPSLVGCRPSNWADNAARYSRQRGRTEARDIAGGRCRFGRLQPIPSGDVSCFAPAVETKGSGAALGGRRAGAGDPGLAEGICRLELETLHQFLQAVGQHGQLAGTSTYLLDAGTLLLG